MKLKDNKIHIHTFHLWEKLIFDSSCAVVFRSCSLSQKWIDFIKEKHTRFVLNRFGKHMFDWSEKETTTLSDDDMTLTHSLTLSLWCALSNEIKREQRTSHLHQTNMRVNWTRSLKENYTLSRLKSLLPITFFLCLEAKWSLSKIVENKHWQYCAYSKEYMHRRSEFVSKAFVHLYQSVQYNQSQ